MQRLNLFFVYLVYNPPICSSPRKKARVAEPSWDEVDDEEQHELDMSTDDDDDDDDDEVQHVCIEKLEEGRAIWDGQGLWCFLLGAKFSWWSFLCARVQVHATLL